MWQTGRTGTRNIALNMSFEQFDASKATIHLLIDAEVLFFYQYFAEHQKLVIEAANAPAVAVSAGLR